MKGLMVTLNGDKKVFGPPGEGEVTLTVTISHDEEYFTLNAGGYNPVEGVFYDWIKTQINPTDSIAISLLDSVESSALSEPLYKRDSCQKDDSTDKRKLDYYRKLEKELMAEGLL